MKRMNGLEDRGVATRKWVQEAKGLALIFTKSLLNFHGDFEFSKPLLIRCLNPVIS